MPGKTASEKLHEYAISCLNMYFAAKTKLNKTFTINDLLPKAFSSPISALSADASLFPDAV